MMALAKGLLFALAAYGLFCAMLYLAQRHFLYHPQPTRISPAAAGFPAAEEVALTSSDGEQLIAWHAAPRPGKAVVVFFHGNADALARRVSRFAQLTADGTGLIALSYRGYGGSTGWPSEQGLYRDAAAAYAFAVARYSAERLVVWGFSLGTGPAVALAVERPIGRLVLESPFTSIADIAAAAMPFVPVRLLLKDQYHSDRRIGRLRVPLLIMQGGHDQIVPLTLCKRLYALAPEPKRFVLFPEGRHENLDEYGAVAAVQRFMDSNVE
jgi:fermentation-respiration switch protein FrsA (DUF1100 family)